MKILNNARVHAYDPRSGSYTRYEGLILDGARIAGFGADVAGFDGERVDLGGATVLAAFADCHVHLTDTGYFLEERNFADVRSYAQFESRVAALPKEQYVLAGQYDESSWSDGRLADAQGLERSFGDARAMLVRIDGHSCIVNRKTFEWLRIPSNAQGIERDGDGAPTGKLFLEANWSAQSRFMAALPQPSKRAAERRATELALSNGALHLHVQLVGFDRDAYAAEIAALSDLPPAKWYPKICEPDPALASELGLPFVGGDVFLDGSIGSCTAALTEPFLVSVRGGEPGRGELRYTDEQLYAYFSQAEALGVSAGVHAIGDRAIEQCISTWQRVLDGKPSARGNRHFIEHFEIARPEHIDACVAMGIYLSMQPQFDLLWGGAGRMYDERLGTERMRSMNALGRIQAAGGVLCGGDDSPVCDLSPLTGMQACVDHHEAAERLTAEQALTMYTYNAARFGHVERQTGLLAPGYAADFVVLDRDPVEGGAAFTDCTVMQTWCDGETVFG
ncbi:MAG: amidohydrolase family protein [Candidatus Eremiobacteraeota bacterium]|nr:amidohydrolase family protein [Candidatus Eremiobacteraeota bacterium]